MDKRKQNIKSEIGRSGVMVSITTSLTIWCLCLLWYNLISRNSWVIIFFVLNVSITGYYVSKIIKLLKRI